MKGMVAIVTGASRGLGRAIAREYAREGASVVLTARPRSPTGLPGTILETAADIEANGGKAFPVPCDVSDEDQVKEMVQKVMDRYGKIDMLVNNAGIMIIGEPFLDIDPDRFDQLMAANVRGPYLTCRHVVPIMMDQRRGRHSQHRLSYGCRARDRVCSLRCQQSGHAPVQLVPGRRIARI